MYTWTFDAPSGVHKNHALSSDLRMAAIAQTVGLQFVGLEPGYGKKMGESITITRVSNIAEPTNGRLVEGIRISEDELTLSTTAITVSEWGRAVPYTSLSQDLSKFDPENIIQKKLMEQLKLTMDTAAFAAFRSSEAKVKAIPDGVASLTFDTDGVPSTQATVNLNTFHIEEIRDAMFSTYLIPPYEGGDYMSLISTKAKRGVTRDPNWEIWHQYTDPQSKYNSEIGRYEGVRFVEVNHANALSGALGLAGVLGEAVFFGDDAVTMVVAQDPELRRGLPEDFGREKAVAWYGILEFGVVWNTANPGEARIVHVTSS